MTFTVVGITPPGFVGPDVGRTFDVAVPLASEPLIHGRESWLSVRRMALPLMVVVRVKPGQTLGGASETLQRVQPEIRDATLPMNWPTYFLGQYLKDAFTLVPLPRDIRIYAPRTKGISSRQPSEGQKQKSRLFGHLTNSV